MKIIKYVCDRCKKEISTSFRLVPYYVGTDEKLCPADRLFPDQEKGDYCSECIYKALELLGWSEDTKPIMENAQEESENVQSAAENAQEEPESVQSAAKNVSDEGPDTEPEEEPEEKPADYITVNLPAPAETPKKKKYDPAKKGRLTSINKELGQEVTRRYRAGEEMETIAEELNIYMSVLSRYIDKKGLGKERYQGKLIEHSGSAPIQDTYLGTI